MNDAYRQVIAASDDDRRGLFLTCAQRLGTTLQNIEKDFWVCWTLDALFHGLPSGGPRLLFKGGTSLSKGYNLISRFSEDIDITVFRDDLGARASVHELTRLTKTARSKRLDGIRAVCQAYINDSLLGILSDLAAQTMVAIGRDRARLSIDPDPADPDKQSLLIRYPSVADGSGYVRPFVKIESGAKSALDPNESRTITPYLSADLTDGDALAVVGVTTIDPQRTFLDKVLILHGLPIFFEKNKDSMAPDRSRGTITTSTGW
jgi:Nucleotidyl transferase AbiEii toxin, Type IV TA system